MIALLSTISMILTLVWWVFLIMIIMSWLISFNVINTRNQFVAGVWRVLNQVTEPPVKQVAVKAAAPSSEAGLQMQRFQHAATRGPQPASIATTEDHVEWVNFAIGGLIVALVFSLLYLGVSRTQMPGKPRPQA